MNYFIQKVKLFYSQNYREVYDDGKLLDVKSLYPSQTWDFEVSGLEKYSEEEAYFEEYGYSLKTKFNLEDVPKFLSELSLETKPQYPENFVKSYRFYKQVFNETDSGSVCTFVVTIDKLRIFTTYAFSDGGGHGWLEIYDAGGNNFGAARTDGIRISWRSLDFIRNNFQRRYQE